MGDASFTRIAAGLSTWGISEIAQKKPLQNIGKSDVQKNVAGVKGTGKWIADPIHEIVGLGKGLMPKGPKIPEPKTVDPVAVQQASSEAARARARSRGYRSTILSQQMLGPVQDGLKTTMGA